MTETLCMDAQGAAKIQELRRRLDRGEYRIDPGAVADALIRHAAGLELAGDYARLAERTPPAPVRARRRTRLLTGESRFAAQPVGAR
jgi:Anti-sigma-28 factor, FlgM